LAFSTIQGSGGAPDSFVGTAGVDTLSFVNTPGNFVLTALGDNDVVNFIQSGNAPAVTGATLKGGDGNDTFSSTNAVVFDNAFINGNAGADNLLFGASTFVNSKLQGGQGNDIIQVRSLNSSLINGNKDNDTITVGNISSSSVFGGQGADTITLNGAILNSIVNGDKDNDLIFVNATAFTNSTIFGGDGQDVINAAGSNVGVVISGDAGDDTLIGSAFADTIFGGEGNDTITGGAGADILTGGAGANWFRQRAVDFGVNDAAAAATVAAGTIDTITDWKFAGNAGNSDRIFGTAFTGIQGNLANSATYSAALALADAAGAGTFRAAVGTGTSWTLYLFESQGVGDPTTAAIQLGTTGQFGTAALALASLNAAQIV
jgi:Ca2+-binding RTX toxin-like protein